jgi:hypothetical protein
LHCTPDFLVARCSHRDWTCFDAFGIKRAGDNKQEFGYEETLLGFRGFGLRRFADRVDAG